MKKIWIDSTALVAGTAGGPSALVAANAAQPPIVWDVIPFLFIGCVVGTVFVIGLQIVRSTPTYGRVALRVFEPLSALVLGSGLSALVAAFIAKDLGPASALFLAVGIGLAVGVVVASLLFNARFKSAL